MSLSRKEKQFCILKILISLLGEPIFNVRSCIRTGHSVWISDLGLNLLGLIVTRQWKNKDGMTNMVKSSNQVREPMC